MKDLDTPTIVVTGGNSGIGLETAVALAGRGAEVVIGCRDPRKAAGATAEIRRRSGNESVRSLRLDLADLRSVERFAAELSTLDHIDVLVNNAGLVCDRRMETAQGFELTFGTNHLGHFHLTNLVLDQLRAAPSGRIVNLASVAHARSVDGITWSDIGRYRRYRTWRVYGDSKLANILHAEALAERLADTSVVAHAVHPGSVRTGFGRDGDTSGATASLMELNGVAQRLGLLRTPEQGAATSVHVATSAAAGRRSGLYWRDSHPARVAPWTRRRGDTAVLWENSKRLVSAVS